jgi:hypothetical protein
MNGSAGTHLLREIAHSDLLKGNRIAGGFDVLHVVAGVPPAACGIHRGACRIQRLSARCNIVVVVQRRSRIHDGVAIVQMSGRAPQAVLDIVRAVTFALVEEPCIEQQSGVELSGDATAKLGDCAFKRPATAMEY